MMSMYQVLYNSVFIRKMSWLKRKRNDRTGLEPAIGVGCPLLPGCLNSLHQEIGVAGGRRRIHYATDVLEVQVIELVYNFLCTLSFVRVQAEQQQRGVDMFDKAKAGHKFLTHSTDEGHTAPINGVK